jgi:hypothetical protein
VHEEPAAPPSIIVETPPPISSEIQMPLREEPQPEGRRTMYLLFFLTLAATLVGVIIGYSLGDDADSPEQPTGNQALINSPRQTDPGIIRKTLVFLQDEMVENARVLKRRRETGQQALVDPTASSQILKNDAWKATLNSGRIQDIADVDLLKAVVEAYRHVEEIKILEWKRFETSSVTGRPLAADRTGAEAISATLMKISPIAEKALVDAAVLFDRSITATK